MCIIALSMRCMLLGSIVRNGRNSLVRRISCDCMLSDLMQYVIVSIPMGVELASYLICCWGEGSLPKNGLRHPRITEVPPTRF